MKHLRLHHNLLEHLAAPRGLLFIPLPVCLMPNKAFVIHAVFVVIFGFSVVALCVFVCFERKIGQKKAAKSFLPESHFSVAD